MLIVPAMNDPTAETASAAPPRSFLGHLKPVDTGHHRRSLSGDVQRMEVVDPPYMAP